MIKNLTGTVLKLLSNIWFYIILLISIFMSFFVTDDSITMEGMKMTPTVIGVVLGGIITTIAIIFSMIKDEEFIELYKCHGDVFSNALDNLKYHTLLILVALLSAILSFFFAMPSILVQLIETYGVCNMQLFYFSQIFFLLITFYSTVEVISILFLILEIKLVRLKREVDKKN